MQRLTTVLALALAAGSAGAQSFNIDFNLDGGPGGGAPAMTFGGPAAQAGYWNTITRSSPDTITLGELDSAPSAVTFTRATNGVFDSANSPNTTGEREKLMDDYQTIDEGTMAFTFSNLQPGKYAVYTTAANPAFISAGSVHIANCATYCMVTQTVAGVIPAAGFVAGKTHALHIKEVTDGSLTVNISDSVSGAGVISGLQLVKLPTPRIRIYVDTNASGVSDGSSWLNAYTDLQDALAAAHAGGGLAFEIWVANGFYYPGTLRTFAFEIPGGTKIYGGFAGSETSLAQRTAWAFNATYLSGSIGTASQFDNSYKVVTLAAADSNTEFDGFYIVRGYNNSEGIGAGLYVYNGGSPTIRNCNFYHNQAMIRGGAIGIEGASPTIVNCTFHNNETPFGVGGAVSITSPGQLKLNTCRFLGNTASGNGGAVHIDNCDATIAGCLFSGNTCGDEGGAIYGAGLSKVIKLGSSTLSKNAGPHNTGGIYVTDGLGLETYNSILWGNTGGLGNQVTIQQIGVNMSAGAYGNGAYNTTQGQNPDPLFVNALGADGVAGTFDDDCRLRQASPCIDAGSAAVLPLDFGDSNMNGVWNEPLPVDADLKPRRVEITSVTNTTQGGTPALDRGCYEFQLAQWCYVNCDNSSVAPALNVQDFACFLNKFSAGDDYANCDNSTVLPTLNVQDFSCFLNKFAAGCP